MVSRQLKWHTIFVILTRVEKHALWEGGPVIRSVNTDTVGFNTACIYFLEECISWEVVLGRGGFLLVKGIFFPVEISLYACDTFLARCLVGRTDIYTLMWGMKKSWRREIHPSCTWDASSGRLSVLASTKPQVDRLSENDYSQQTTSTDVLLILLSNMSSGLAAYNRN